MVDSECKMSIDAVTGATAYAPLARFGGASAQPSQSTSAAAVVQLALQDQEHKGGGGGHGAKKNGLEAISQLAAAVMAKPKPASKTLQQRIAEIERMKREASGEE